MFKYIRSLLEKSETIVVDPEDFEEEVKKFDKITSLSYSIKNDQLPKEAFRKAEDFTLEKFDKWIEDEMVSLNGKSFTIDLTLMHKDKLTGYKLKFVAKRNLSTNKIKYKYYGVYGYLVPFFTKRKALYYFLLHYLPNYKNARVFIQNSIKELIWRSILV